LCLLICSSNLLQAQDSVYTLNAQQLVSIIKQYHPLVREANIALQRSQAGILEAKGAFDPAAKLDFERKSFDNKLYYNYFNPNINIPTWYGVDIKAGLEEIGGSRTDEEYTFGKSSYLGINAPLHNIYFDKRRAVLQQSKQLNLLSETQLQLLINDVLYEAISLYWSWINEYQSLATTNNIIVNNLERYKYVKIEYEQGARPAIDTIEALTQLQNFYLIQQQQILSFQQVGLELANYLWLNNNTPIQWRNTIMPDTTSMYIINTDIIAALQQHLVAIAPTQHPKLQGYKYKLAVLDIERKLKAQSFLPKVNVQGNLLSKGYAGTSVQNVLLDNNYKFGVDFSMPIFLREARGAYQASKFKINETELQQSNDLIIIQNKIKNYSTQALNLEQQINIQNGALNNFNRLFRAERTKFDIGESTLFVLNSRENKVYETTLKLIELRTKYQKSIAALYWAGGQLR
jgi:outer membrane protein TolC